MGLPERTKTFAHDSFMGTFGARELSSRLSCRSKLECDGETLVICWRLHVRTQELVQYQWQRKEHVGKGLSGLNRVQW